MKLLIITFLFLYWFMSTLAVGMYVAHKGHYLFRNFLFALIAGWLAFPALLGSYLGNKFIDATENGKL